MLYINQHMSTGDYVKLQHFQGLGDVDLVICQLH